MRGGLEHGGHLHAAPRKGVPKIVHEKVERILLNVVIFLDHVLPHPSHEIEGTHSVSASQKSNHGTTSAYEKFPHQNSNAIGLDHSSLCGIHAHKRESNDHARTGLRQMPLRACMDPCIPAGALVLRPPLH